MGGNNPPKNAPKFKEKQTLQTQTLSCFHINHHGNVFFLFLFFNLAVFFLWFTKNVAFVVHSLATMILYF